MATEPQTIEKKYSRLKWIAISSCIFLMVISFLFFIYAWVQRQEALKNQEMAYQISRKCIEIEKKLVEADEKIKDCENSK